MEWPQALLSHLLSPQRTPLVPAHTLQDVPGEALVTISQPTSPLRAAKSPKVSQNRTDRPYLTEDEPLDKEEQDSRHDARKKG